jgi:hypothetical protein
MPETKRRPYLHLKDAQPEPGDELVGSWSRKRLVKSLFACRWL